MIAVVVRFHQVSISGKYSQPQAYAARTAPAVQALKNWLRNHPFALLHEVRKAGTPNPSAASTRFIAACSAARRPIGGLLAQDG